MFHAITNLASPSYSSLNLTLALIYLLESQATLVPIACICVRSNYFSLNLPIGLGYSISIFFFGQLVFIMKDEACLIAPRYEQKLLSLLGVSALGLPDNWFLVVGLVAHRFNA